MEENVAEKISINPGQAARIGVYVCHCGLNIAQTVNCRYVAETASELDKVIVSKDIAYACSEPGQKEIKVGTVGDVHWIIGLQTISYMISR